MAEKISSQTHESLVAQQFGPQAQAYVTSAVHAQGPDLDYLIGLLRQAGPSARLLDLGCGGGHVALNAAPYIREIMAYDLSAEMLAAVASRALAQGLDHVLTRQGVAESLPFPNHTFDFVFSRYSAHHWRDLPAALREIRRVLRPGGLVAFADVVSPGPPMLDTHLQAIELLRDPSHIRDYSVREWLKAFAEAGFAAQCTRNFRLPLEFSSWVQRMRTPAGHVASIRSLQAGAASAVKAHFEIQPEGSFTLDTAVFEAR